MEAAPLLSPEALQYPDSDGQPLADNTEQLKWIKFLFDNLDVMLPHDFVAGDLLWYPVQGHPEIRVAPDVLVALGRPKGRRGSYKQWEEDNVPLTVVFEIWSPSNTFKESISKTLFYQRHGVQEFYLYDPDTQTLAANVRRGETLEPVSTEGGFTSPLLGIHMEATPDGLKVSRPDGAPFRFFEELVDQVKAAQQQAEAAQQQAEAAQQQAEAERQRAERLAEKLRALGIAPE